MENKPTKLFSYAFARYNTPKDYREHGQLCLHCAKNIAYNTYSNSRLTTYSAEFCKPCLDEHKSKLEKYNEEQRIAKKNKELELKKCLILGMSENEKKLVIKQKELKIKQMESEDFLILYSSKIEEYKQEILIIKNTM